MRHIEDMYPRGKQIALAALRVFAIGSLGAAFSAVAASGQAVTTFTVTGAGTGQDQGTFPTGINAAGEVAGYYVDANSIAHGFTRSAKGTITTFNAFGSQSQGTIVAGVNAAGVTVGSYNYCVDPACDQQQIYGFLRSSAGGYLQIAVSGATSTAATAINDSGEITGNWTDADNNPHGFIWEKGVITTFDFEGAVFTSPVAISDVGYVVGTYGDSAGALHGFLRNSEGNYTQLDAPNAVNTWATSINTAEDIVGYFVNDSGTPEGFVLQNLSYISFVFHDGSFSPSVAGNSPVVNSTGEIAGVVTIDEEGLIVPSGFTRSTSGKIKEFQVAGANTAADAINSAGNLAGYYLEPGGGYAGFVMF